jgi:hypothetical protein
MTIYNSNLCVRSNHSIKPAQQSAIQSSNEEQSLNQILISTNNQSFKLHNRITQI